MLIKFKRATLFCLRDYHLPTSTSGNCFLLLIFFFQLTIFQASGANSFGVVVGGSSIEQRRLCATEVSKRNVSGFYLFIYFNIFNSLGKEWRLS